jgi:hypothetical protein
MKSIIKLGFVGIFLLIMNINSHAQGKHFSFTDTVFTDGATKVLNFDYDTLSCFIYQPNYSLDSLIRFMDENKQLNVIIKYFVKINHTNSNYYNYTSSSKNAKLVKDYLVKRGIKKKRIYAVGLGPGNYNNELPALTISRNGFCYFKIEVEIYNPKNKAMWGGIIIY